MNIPLVAGGAAAAIGITAGVIAERSSHAKLEQRRDGVEAQREVGREWVAGANDQFGSEITTDRLRSRDLDAKIEDYRLDNPSPEGVGFRREARWNSGVSIKDPNRERFWMATIMGAGFSGATVGGMTLAVAAGGARTTGSIAGAAIGAAICAGGLGILAGSAVSNWTH